MKIGLSEASMDNTNSISIIHRKARVAREGFDARAMNPAKALRLGLARSADKLFELAVGVTTLEQTSVTTKDLLSQMDGQGMLVLLDGVDGARAVACFDGQSVTAIVEQQISGQVRAVKAADRAYTRTDAAMIAPLLDATLERYDTQLSEHNEAYRPSEFRFGDRVEDTRALSLLLDDGQFDLFRLTLDLAEGAKTGVIFLALPHRKTKKSASNRIRGDKDQKSPVLHKQALDAPVAFTTVIARLNQPLNVVCNLQQGAVLPLPLGCLGQSELVTSLGHLVADVHLGQLSGMRAVRVMLPGFDQPSESGASDGARDIENGQLPKALEPEEARLQIDQTLADMQDLPDLPDDTLAGFDDLPDLDLPDPVMALPATS